MPPAHLLGAGAASGSPTAQFFMDYFVGNGALDIPHYLIRDEVTPYICAAVCNHHKCM